jgi:hypothetical protein
MIVQYACRARSTGAMTTEYLGRPNCPRCGSILLVAEASWFNVAGHIEHAWSCDDCGNAFATSVRLQSR